MIYGSTLLGAVKDVKGASITVALNDDTIAGLAFVSGCGYRVGQVGSFVKIALGYVELFGIVSQAGAGAVPQNISPNQPFGYRWLTVQLVGESIGGSEFRRGLSQYPTIDDDVYLVTESDLARIYGHPDSVNHVRIGHLAGAESIPALLDIDKLITRHSAVVGTTGSGKSTTVAGLLNSLSDAGSYPSSRILIFDLHGEYAAALGDRATVFRINPNANRGEKKLCLPYWAMNFSELLSVSLGSVDEKNVGAVLSKIYDLKAASLAKNPRRGLDDTTLTVDSPVPFSIHKLWFDFHVLLNATHTKPASGQSDATIAYLQDPSGNALQRGDALKVIAPRFRAQEHQNIFLSGSLLNIRMQIESLASRLRDSRFDFLFRPGLWTPNLDGDVSEDLDTLLKEWMGGDSPISILDLSGTPSDIMKEVIGILIRIIYDALFWARNLPEGGRHRPILLIFEEAHSYLGGGDTGPAAVSVKRVVREGRKYGIGGMIVSQRPSEIDATILSQCGTIVAMRLTNSTDRGHIRNVVSDNMEGLLSMLPILRTGEAIVVGESVQLPVRTVIDTPSKNRRPDSGDPSVIAGPDQPGGWDSARMSGDFAEVMEAWRRQDPRATRVKLD